LNFDRSDDSLDARDLMRQLMCACKIPAMLQRRQPFGPRFTIGHQDVPTCGVELYLLQGCAGSLGGLRDVYVTMRVVTPVECEMCECELLVPDVPLVWLVEFLELRDRRFDHPDGSRLFDAG
jgi:hypothetical protein